VAKRVVKFWIAGCCAAIVVAWGTDLSVGGIELDWGRWAEGPEGRWDPVAQDRVWWRDPAELSHDGFEGARVLRRTGLTWWQVDWHRPHGAQMDALVEVGWPWRCLRREESQWCDMGGAGAPDRSYPLWRRGITVWPLALTRPPERVPNMPNGVRVGPEYRLSVRPMVIGLGADGAVWGVLMVLASESVRRVRRMRRERRNRCVKCGYDRTGLAIGAVCPECGSGASKVEMATSPP
jgi:hypothetical protein